MQSLVAYKCTSSKNKEDPATLLLIVHKDSNIWMVFSGFLLKKKKPNIKTTKSHVTLPAIMRSSNVTPFLHIY